ncbi:MAG: Chromosome partition protein Smc [Myxococcota bacterium]|nr:Chromosome partition protein Smc [Myxococcota bacterium]
MSQRNIVIIDNDKDLAYAIAHAFEEKGWRPRVAADAEHGLALARETVPDLIFLAVELPDMSGFSVCSMIKRDRALGAVPVILCSSDSSQDVLDQHSRQKNAANTYLLKPVEAGTVVAKGLELLPEYEDSPNRPSTVLTSAIEPLEEEPREVTSVYSIDDLEGQAGSRSAGGDDELTPDDEDGGGNVQQDVTVTAYIPQRRVSFSVDEFLRQLEEDMDTIEREEGADDSDPGADRKKRSGADWYESKLNIMRANLRKRSKQIARFKVAVDSLQREFRQAEDVLGVRDSEIKNLRKARENFRARIADLEAANEDLRQKIDELAGRVNDMEAARTRQEAAARELSAEYERKLKHAEDLRALLADEKSALKEEYEIRRGEWLKAKETLDGQIAALRAEHEQTSSALEESLKQARQAAGELTGRLAEAHREINAARSDLEEAVSVRNNRIAELENELLTIREELTRRQEETVRLMGERDSRIRQLESEMDAARREQETAEAEMHGRLDQLVGEMEALAAAKEAVENDLSARLSGFEHKAASLEQSLREAVRKAAEREAALETQLEEANERIGQLEVELMDIRTERDGLANALGEEKGRAEEFAGLLKEEQRRTAQLRDDLAAQKSQSEFDLARAREELAERDSAIGQLREEAELFREESQEREQQYERDHNALKQMISALENALAQEKQTTAALIAARDEAVRNGEEQARNLQGELQAVKLDLEARERDLNGQIQTLDGKLRESQRKEQELAAAITAAAAEKEQLQTEFTAQLSKWEDELNNLTERAATAEARNVQLDQLIQRERTASKEFETEWRNRFEEFKKERDAQITGYNRKLAEAEGRIRALKERAQSSAGAGDEKVRELEEKLRAHEEKFNARELELQRTQAERERFRQELAEVNANAARAVLEAEQDRARLRAQAEKDIQAVREQAANREQEMLRKFQPELENARKQAGEREGRMNELQPRLEKLQAALVDAEARIRTLTDELTQVRQTASQSGGVLAERELRIEDLKRKLDDMRSASKKNEERIIKAYARVREDAKVKERLKSALMQSREAMRAAGLPLPPLPNPEDLETPTTLSTPEMPAIVPGAQGGDA